MKHKTKLLSRILIVTLLSMFSNFTGVANAKSEVFCEPIQILQNGTPYPVLCSDGSPNLNAKKPLKLVAKELMRLNSISTATKVQKAICADLSKGSTFAIEMAAYDYVYALFDWNTKWIDSQEILDLLVNDKFCATEPISKSQVDTKPSNSKKVSAMEKRIRAGLEENCNNLPKNIGSLKYKSLGMSPDEKNYLYSIGKIRYLAFNAGELGFEFLAYSPSDKKIAESWGCSWAFWG